MDVARERAFDQDADIRFRPKHDVPVFNHPFREVGKEYLLTQEARAKRREISAAQPKKVRAVIEGALDRYVGSTQVHLIGDELWGDDPAWRRKNEAGRRRRNGRVPEVAGAGHGANPSRTTKPEAPHLGIQQTLNQGFGAVPGQTFRRQRGWFLASVIPPSATKMSIPMVPRSAVRYQETLRSRQASTTRKRPESSSRAGATSSRRRNTANSTHCPEGSGLPQKSNLPASGIAASPAT